MWTTIREFNDIKFERTEDGIAKITINRPEVRNAFRPLTVSELTIAADNARFGQTGPRVGSFDAGLGSAYLARIVGQKKAREIWFLCRQYDAEQALEMGLVNTVVPLAELEAETLKWCREMLALSPMALRFLKAAMNADCDGQIGLVDFGGDATLLYYLSEEAQEGRNAYVEKRKPDY